MQPPLHRHVPVTHAVADLHAEVGVVAVDALDGSEVVLVFSRGVGAGNRVSRESLVSTFSCVGSESGPCLVYNYNWWRVMIIYMGGG